MCTHVLSMQMQHAWRRELSDLGAATRGMLAMDAANLRVHKSRVPKEAGCFVHFQW